MKETIDKLIQSDNTDDWLIAYELIIKKYGSFYAYPKAECEYLYISLCGKKLYKAYMINYNMWERNPSKYAQL